MLGTNIGLARLSTDAERQSLSASASHQQARQARRQRDVTGLWREKRAETAWQSPQKMGDQQRWQVLNQPLTYSFGFGKNANTFCIYNSENGVYLVRSETGIECQIPRA